MRTKKYRIIDAHTHIMPKWVDMALEVMDKTGIAASVTLGWMTTHGSEIDKLIETTSEYPGRFLVFGTIDYSNVDDIGFGEKTAKTVEQKVKNGMQGLKIYKTLGLEVKDSKGNFIKVNDKRFFPVWETAGKLEIPVLIHSADPQAFWQPPDKNNFWSGVLKGEWSQWSYYRKGYPSRDELLAERNDILEKFPQTIFLGAHFGSLSENLQELSELLDKYKNFYIDVSARLPDIVTGEQRRKEAIKFFEKYQDRIIFGTDLIYDDVWIKSGIQIQTFLTEDDLDEKQRSLGVEELYVKTSVNFMNSHRLFFETDKVQVKPPHKRKTALIKMHGLRLNEKILKKIYCENFLKLIK